MNDTPSSFAPRESWEFFGSPLHFIGGWDCHFHMGTLVGPWVVSTVGEYAPGSREFEEIGAGRKYETFVFRATGKRCSRSDCNCDQPEWTGGELDSEGYNLRGDAQRGHYAMCEKWARIDPADTERVGNAWRDGDYDEADPW